MLAVEATFPAGAAAGRCHGNSDPDCVGAGAGVDVDAGAVGINPPCGGALVVEASCARQDFRNCGQVAPPVVRAAFAACHCALRPLVEDKKPTIRDFPKPQDYAISSKRSANCFNPRCAQVSMLRPVSAPDRGGRATALTYPIVAISLQAERLSAFLKESGLNDSVKGSVPSHQLSGHSPSALFTCQTRQASVGSDEQNQ
jgi:hypothetical protein